MDDAKTLPYTLDWVVVGDVAVDNGEFPDAALVAIVNLGHNVSGETHRVTCVAYVPPYLTLEMSEIFTRPRS